MGYFVISNLLVLQSITDSGGGSMKTLPVLTMAVLIFSSCLIIAPHAETADWVLVSDAKTTITYADQETLLNSKGNDFKKVWMKKVFRSDTTYDYFLDLYEYDCANMRYRVLQGKTYYKNGDIKDATTEPSWRYGMPESPAEAVIGFVCKKM
jgi:hypothetical protein